MQRIIEVKVKSDYLTKDSDQAGNQYEANVTILRLTFDESWDGFAKKVVFWNARGEGPVQRILTTDMLEDITQNPRIYLCPIPGEPMAVAGKCEFVVEGYVDGKRQRTVGDKLKVRQSPYSLTETEPADPTPSQAEQLQTEIDGVIKDIQRAVDASNEADKALATALEAQNAAGAAMEAAAEATQAAEDAKNAVISKHASKHGASGDDPITPAMIGAATPADVDLVEELAHTAIDAAGDAHTAATNAQNTANAAAQAAATAQSTANSAATAATNANNNANGRLSTGGGTVTGRIKAAGFDTTDYTQPFEAPEHIDFHSGGSVLDYNGRLSILTDGDLYYRKPNGVGGRMLYEYMITKSTADIGAGVAMAPGTWYAVYE